ncbi:hypothetical protein AM499_04830 [Bacillus sp. FJAT-22090]|uniref:DUF4190 domain-containing protein n=1 Tax=Bacillus sp. FJAT-22090 TaxID=1581038 RepID=UPI0006AEDA72|nr:DUF4190 domain-containing protein [Bacillus sp. FJAT-22090]ALC85216.1 hypothetical protein AM499_04830 [Bacillus sp. FJAT-22090]
MVEKTQTNNSKSVISLTLGILSILIPYIGLILGVIGVVVSRRATKEIVKTDEGGSGLATSGLICSVVGFIIQLFLVVSIIAFYSLTNVS